MQATHNQVAKSSGFCPSHLTVPSHSTGCLEVKPLNWRGLDVGTRSANRDLPKQTERETQMKNLTYQSYLSDPAVRAQLEREVRLARAQAVHQFIVAPLMRLFKRLFKRLPVLQPRTA
jgi:hypothetical protein